MEFNSNKPIYLQIYDLICERVLGGNYSEEERIPSVREFGAEIGVNPNTVMRSYEKLTGRGIIYNKRGIGYFISHDAKRLILESHKVEFITDELPALIRKMRLLGVSLEEFEAIWSNSNE